MHTVSPIIISFYTLRTPYQQEVLHLMESIEKWGLEARIEGKESLGSWEHNCAYKPAFILQKLQQLKRPVLWVDADAVFCSPPKWEDVPVCDLALRINSSLPRTHSSRILSGTLFVNDTLKAKNLMIEWIKACTRELHALSQLKRIFGDGCSFWDQMALNEVLLRNKRASVRALPLSYCTIFDLDRSKQVVIEHHQASRRFKQLIV
jgi:hypothetical protein